jgi:hypothetical protein
MDILRPFQSPAKVAQFRWPVKPERWLNEKKGGKNKIIDKNVISDINDRYSESRIQNPE